MLIHRTIAAAALLAFAAPAQAEPQARAKPGLAARAMISLERVSKPRLSPDGRRVIYEVRATDWAADRGVARVWIADTGAGGSAPRPLANIPAGAGAVRWSADGRSILYLSRRSGSAQVWRAPADGAGAPVQVTDLPLDVGAFHVSADGTRLVVGLAVFPDCPDLACTVARRKATAAGPGGQAFDRLFVRQWDTWVDGTNNHLFTLAIGPDGRATGTPRDLMPGFDGDVPSKPFGDEETFTLTPDGRTVIYSARVAGTTEPWSTNFDLWRVPADGSAAPVNLTPGNPAWDRQPIVSPDGRRLAWRAQRRPGFESDRWAVWVRDLSTGAEREIAPNWDRSVKAMAWSADGRRILGVADDLGQTRVFALDVARERVRPLTGDGHIGEFDTAAGVVAYSWDSLSDPAQVFAAGLDGKAAPRRLTDHNRDALAAIEMGASEQFTFAGWNGDTVHGYVVKPVGWRPGRKYPTAFLIHGGPQSSMGNMFHYRWNPQVYAAAGYAVVMVDFHGSTGYGQAFSDAISEHWGDRPLEDLQKGWAHALKAYDFLDGERACALGASYGGYMINWMAGVWNDPWKCLVSHDGHFDTRVMGYSTEQLWFPEWETGGTVYDNPEGYDRFNPLTRVSDWKKPILVVQGARDFRIPAEQGIAAFTAAQRRGVPSRFLYFPDENHWVLKPRNSQQWHDEVIAWLDRWTAAPGAAR